MAVGMEEKAISKAESGGELMNKYSFLLAYKCQVYHDRFLKKMLSSKGRSISVSESGNP